MTIYFSSKLHKCGCAPSTSLFCCKLLSQPLPFLLQFSSPVVSSLLELFYLCFTYLNYPAIVNKHITHSYFLQIVSSSVNYISFDANVVVQVLFVYVYCMRIIVYCYNALFKTLHSCQVACFSLLPHIATQCDVM